MTKEASPTKAYPWLNILTGQAGKLSTPPLPAGTASGSSTTATAVTNKLKNNDQLNKLVEEFYQTEFWNKLQGDLLSSQLIADELFESSINIGVFSASEILQRTINLLNRNISLYPDIAVDGIIGKQTIEALKKCLATNGEKLIYNLLNFYQAKRYIEIMERDHTQEIFIGWFSRIDIIK